MSLTFKHIDWVIDYYFSIFNKQAFFWNCLLNDILQCYFKLLEKCNHVKDCAKLTNLKNTVPHADLTKCQDCSKLDNESSVTSGDKKSESCESGESELDLTQNEEKPGICVCLRCGNIVR